MCPGSKKSRKRHNRCIAGGCPVKTRTHVDDALFRFPANPKRFKEWCEVANFDNPDHWANVYLCHRHFRQDDFVSVGARTKLRHLSNPSFATGPLNPVTNDYQPVDGAKVIKVEPRYPSYQHEQQAMCLKRFGVPRNAELGSPSDEESHIPPCYRFREPAEFSPFSFVIIPLEPEFGFDAILINDHKYLKCDPEFGDDQLWRCAAKSCPARACTSAVHFSILCGLFGSHCHQLEKPEPEEEVAEWAPTDSPSPGEQWPPLENEADERDWNCGPARSIKVERPTSPFGFRFVAVPGSFGQGGSPQPQQPPIFSFQESFSRFQPSLTRPDMFSCDSASQLSEGALQENEHQIPYTLDVDTELQASTSDPLLIHEQAEYDVQSPDTENINVVGDNLDDTSDGSSSERRTDDPSFYQIHDVRHMIAKSHMSVSNTAEAAFTNYTNSMPWVFK